MNCVFCEKIEDGSAEPIGQVGVHHFEPLNPVTPGHRLFVPREHVERVNINHAIVGLTFNIASRWAEEKGGDFNLIINVGPDATQTIPHLHVHYIPRTSTDGLALPWTDQEFQCRETIYNVTTGTKGFCQSKKRDHITHFFNS